MLHLAVFFAGNAEMFVIREELTGCSVFFPVVDEPLLVGDDGVVHPDEEGLQVGWDIGLEGFEGEGCAGEDRVGKMEGGVERGLGKTVKYWESEDKKNDVFEIDFHSEKLVRFRQK